MSTQTKPRSNFWFVWRMPLLLAALTLFALIIALVKTGVWHWAAWAALATPIVVGLWYSFVRQSR
ncbi:hypothetical protein [Oxalicibacterium faecigallinarum]|uniref:hypothetical protein n=1 Tax=Oxalicibacterium faecigallinarum TaxID=573741 RepID=UPI0016646AA7|nr:hypothetical protein [Oxalicibacterium faecigallinarum]